MYQGGGRANKIQNGCCPFDFQEQTEYKFNPQLQINMNNIATNQMQGHGVN